MPISVPEQGTSKGGDLGSVPAELTVNRIWLIDLAQELGLTEKNAPTSNIQLDGFDIDIVQCPQPEWLPGNINFHVWNAFESPESKFVGQYDIVHVRLFGINVRDTEHGIQVISNLKKILSMNSFSSSNEPLILIAFSFLSRARRLDPVGGSEEFCEPRSQDQPVPGDAGDGRVTRLRPSGIQEVSRRRRVWFPSNCEPFNSLTMATTQVVHRRRLNIPEPGLREGLPS